MKIFESWTFVSLAMGTLTLFTGCDRHSHSNHSADHHDHEEKIAQITVWTDRYEIFAEHKAPVTRQTLAMPVHITEITSGEPLSQGPVQLLARQNESVIEQTVSNPARPGIFVVEMAFPNPGDWALSLSISNFSIALGVITVFADAHSAAHAEFPEPPVGISFLKEQQWNLQTMSELPSRRKMTARFQTLAQVEAKPGFSASIAAPFAGHLAAPPGKSFPLPGSRVKAGEILAILQPRYSEAATRFLELQSESAQAEAVLKQAEANYERTKKLAAAQAKSERELQEAELALASARARHRATMAWRSPFGQQSTNGLSSNFLPAFELSAPIDGILTHTSAGIGQPVTADQVLFTVLNPETVWIHAHAPEHAIGQVQNAAGALCETLDGTGRIIPVSEEGGQLIFTGLQVNPETRTVPIIFEFPNTNSRLLVGQTVRMHLETGQALDALAIPNSALVEEGGLFVAFIQVSGETFQKRELTLGIRDGQWIQVLSGINPGERVVTQGAYAIRLASASGAIPAHGHAH